VEAAGAAQRLAHLARRQTHHAVGEQGGQLAALAPAEVAALQGLLAGGVGDGQLAEVGTGAQLVEHLLCRGARRLYLFRRRAFRHGDEDVAEVIFGVEAIATGLAGEEVVHLLLRDLDPAFHFAGAQIVHGDLMAHLFAEFREVCAIALQGLAELLQRQLALAGDARDHLVEGLVVDAHAAAAGEGELDALDDQPFQHLAAQDLHGRQGGAVLTQLRHDTLQPLFQFQAGDGLVVHHGDDTVQFFHLGGMQREGGEQAAQQGGEEGNALH